MFGALFSAGASLLGGLFGKKKATPQVTESTQTTDASTALSSTSSTSTINYAAMVKAAEGAGFNPLTVLRNGGSAGFMEGTQNTISMTPQLTTRTSSTTSGGSSGSSGPDYGQIFGSLGQAVGDYMDPIASKKRAVESAVYDAQLEGIKNGPKAASYFGDVPGKSGSPIVSARTPAMGVRSGRDSVSYPGGGVTPSGLRYLDTPPIEAGKNPTASGLGIPYIKHNADMPDASQWEQRYAEPGEWVGGLLTMGADALTSADYWFGRAKQVLTTANANTPNMFYPVLANQAFGGGTKFVDPGYQAKPPNRAEAFRQNGGR